MTKKIAFWIFLLGTLSSAVVFLALTWDTHRQVAVLSNADKIDDRVVAGKRAFEKYNCNDCHTILGFGAYYGPDLTRVIQRIGDEGVRFRIKSPELAFANSWRKMPNVHASDAEIADMTRWFEAHTIRTHGRYRVVEPLVVVEIAFDVIMRSTRHKSGFALRFPRIARLRPDKTPDEVDTLATVTRLYEGLQHGAEHLVTASARR